MAWRTRLCFYQTRSAWSVDQGSNKNHSPAYNFAPTVTKFCVMWEGLSLQHDTKFGNCRCTIVDSRAFLSWSLIHGLCWSGLIKAEPGCMLNQPRSPHKWMTLSLRAGFMGPTWGPLGADMTQVGPMLATWTLLSGLGLIFNTELDPLNKTKFKLYFWKLFFNYKRRLIFTAI